MINFLNKYAKKWEETKNYIKAEVPKISNQFLVYEFKTWRDGRAAGSFKTKADKIVYETESTYIVFDKEDMIKYIKDNAIKIVMLDTLLKEIDFKRVLPK